MRLMLLCVLCLALLGACAPKVQTLPETSISSLDPSYAQTLLASFYPDLTRLGVTVKDSTSYGYNGDLMGADRVVVADLYANNEGFCPVRDGTLRANGRPYVLVLAADGNRGVRGVVYDESREPRLTYAYFTGQSLQPLATRCR